jgi:hypothetical protein
MRWLTSLGLLLPIRLYLRHLYYRRPLAPATTRPSA